MKTIKDIFSKIIKFILKITGDDLSIYAAQASFFIIISVIPFSMLVLSIIKLFINIDINSILHTINSFAPAAISTFLTETITDLFTKSGSVQVISVTAVSTLWLASRGVMALYTGLNKVYRSRSKNYFIGRLISILYTLAFIAALILTIVFFGFGSKLEYFINSHSPFFSTLLDFFLRGKILIFMIYLTFGGRLDGVLILLFNIYRTLFKLFIRLRFTCRNRIFNALALFLYEHIPVRCTDK